MYPDFNSSFHFLGYIKERDDLNAIPGMKRIPEFWAQPQGNFRSLPVTAWLLSSDKLGGWGFLFKSNIYLLRRNTLKINSFASMWNMKCAGKQSSVMEVQRAVASMLSRRKCLVVSVDFKLLALSLLREHIRAERKRSQELAPLSNAQWKMLCGPQPKPVQTASMSLQQVRCWALHKLFSFMPGLLCQKCF